MGHYDKEFYLSIQSSSNRSASAVVPVILDFVQPKTVIDIGCGNGDWLNVFKKHGVSKVLGVDGMWVEKSLLRIDETEFELHDLVTPLQIHEHFDLVISLEVAEHIPASCAETFIDSITKLGPVVLFSAAIPFQGGTITLKKSGRNTGPSFSAKEDSSSWTA